MSATTQVCADGEHHRCFGYVGGPAHDCECTCHPPRDPMAKIVEVALSEVQRGYDPVVLQKISAALAPVLEALAEETAYETQLALLGRLDEQLTASAGRAVETGRAAGLKQAAAHVRLIRASAQLRQTVAHAVRTAPTRKD